MSDSVSVADLIRLPDHYEPVLSPDRERVAFFSDATGRIELYVQRLATGERRQLSDGNVPRNARPLAWSHDGERVYLHADDDGDEQHDIHAMDMTGRREHLVSTDGQCTIQDVGPDGRYLYFTSTAAEPKNLCRHDLQEGGTEQLSDYDQPIAWRSALVSPDGTRIGYATNETDEYGNQDLYVAGADGSNPRKLGLSAVGAESNLADWRGDDLLVYDNSHGLNRVGVYDLSADEVTWYGPGEHEEYAVRFTPDGDVLAIRDRECAWVAVRYEAPGHEGEPFALPAGKHHPPHGTGRSPVVTADGRVLTTVTTADRREKLVAYVPETDDHETIIDAEYGNLDPEQFVDAEHVTYESHDGLEIGGLLYDSGERPSPAVVWAHGGPRGQVLREFDPLFQALLSAGYSVFAPNYRGSTGRGREFMQLVHNDWGGDEQGDIAEAGRWLQGQEWVDEDRVAVVGRSFGGYSTYCQLTMYPELWATGVAIVGISDLRVLYEEAMPHYQREYEQYLGDPEADADFYRERSPVTHVDNMERPICIVHGVNDPICPVTQARRFRDALAERGWTEGEEFEYHELGAEGHVSTDTDKRIRRAEILLDYVQRRL